MTSRTNQAYIYIYMFHKGLPYGHRIMLPISKLWVVGVNIFYIYIYICIHIRACPRCSRKDYNGTHPQMHILHQRTFRNSPPPSHMFLLVIAKNGCKSSLLYSKLFHFQKANKGLVELEWNEKRTRPCLATCIPVFRIYIYNLSLILNGWTIGKRGVLHWICSNNEALEAWNRAQFPSDSTRA